MDLRPKCSAKKASINLGVFLLRAVGIELNGV